MDNFFTYLDDPVSIRLMETLIDLMKDSSLDTVQTSALINHSGIGRTTFYRRYRNKYDFLNQCYQKLLDGTICRISRGFSYREGFFRLYHVLESHLSFFQNALSSQEPDGLMQYIKDECYYTFSALLTEKGIDFSSPIHRLKLSGFIAGTMEITRLWVEKQEFSLEDLYLICKDMMPSDFRQIFDTYYS